MPIRQQHRWLYPIDWQQLTDMVRFERAQGRCEQCARPHGKLIYHLGNGHWWDEEIQRWRNGKGKPVKSLEAPALSDPRVLTTQIYLATGHLDHNPSNNHLLNLRAFCQRCHMMHDKIEHLRRRRITYLMGKSLGDLFTGPYIAI